MSKQARHLEAEHEQWHERQPMIEPDLGVCTNLMMGTRARKMGWTLQVMWVSNSGVCQVLLDSMQVYTHASTKQHTSAKDFGETRENVLIFL